MIGTKATRAALALGVAALLASGCAKKAEGPTLNASMNGVMEPTMEKIWKLASQAYNDIGDGLDPKKISDADWRALGEDSRKIKERATYLATVDHVVVAKENEPLLGSQAVGIKGKIGSAWDAVDAKTVQGRIDANPTLFRKKAQDLVDASDALIRASQTKDADLFYRISSGMDEVCDGCHEPFWGTDEAPAFPH